MNDWDISYAAAGQAFLQGLNPYEAVPTFVNPPWVLMVFAPLCWLPWQVMFFIPALVITHFAFRRGNLKIALLVGTSFPFVALCTYGNYDWVVVLGLMIGGPVGVILQTTKPQAGGLGFVGELRDKTWRQLFWFLLPAAVVALVSTAIFPMWIDQMFGVTPKNAERNISLFPYTIPLAVFCLYRAYRDANPLLGVLGSISLAPYLYIHSLVPLMCLLAENRWKWCLAINLGTWALFLGSIVGVVPIKF